MIRIQRFAGLLSYVSKYFIPPGAATEQTNVCNLLPGQLTVRGGMKEVDNTISTPCLEMYGYSIGNESVDKIFVFTANGGQGEIQIIDSPDV